jgi:hypothetical protein
VNHSVKKNLILGIIAIAIIACIFASLEKWAHDNFKPIVFSNKIRKNLIRKQPHIILVGNSMLGSNIVRPLFEKELSNKLGRKARVSYIIAGGLHTAWFYLVLKNQIATAMKEGTPIVFLDYEDYYIRPEANTTATGKSEVRFRSSMLDDEKVFRSKIGTNGLYFATGFPYLYSQRFQIKRHIVSEFVLKAFNLLGASKHLQSRFFKRQNEDSVAWLLGTVFKGSEFRGGQADDRERNDRILFQGKSDEDFFKKAQDSLLPDMLSYSKKYPLIFLISSSNPSMTQIKSSMPQFSQRLEKYITSNDGYFIDMNRVPEVQTPGLMHDSRHFTKGKGRNTNTLAVLKELEKIGIIDKINNIGEKARAAN